MGASQLTQNRSKLDQFLRLPASGKKENHVAGAAHTQITMHRFHRVQPIGRRCCTGHRRLDLIADQARFTHSADCDTAFRRKNHLCCLDKGIIQKIPDCLDRLDFPVQNFQSEIPNGLSGRD